MIDEDLKHQILNRLSKGLSITENPFAELAQDFDISEQSLLELIDDMFNQGVLKRLGMVVNHHQLGYHANAMVVWDIPDEQIDEIGILLGKQEKVTLCYQRPRRLPDWPYNLFTMIHGKIRQEVLDYLNILVKQNHLEQYTKEVLFSTKKYKQTGARYLA